MTKQFEQDTAAPSGWRTAIGILAGLLFILGLGFAVGVASDLAARPAETADYALGFGILVVLTLCGWLAMRNLRGVFHAVGRPSSKTGKAQWITIASLGLGLILGIVLTSVSGSDVYPGIFSAGGGDDASLPIWFVVLALLVMLVLVPIITVIYHRNADEHETRAMADGGLIAGYAYIQIAGSWWLAWRGGIAPEPDGYILFWGYVAVWLIVANYRKYF